MPASRARWLRNRCARACGRSRLPMTGPPTSYALRWRARARGLTPPFALFPSSRARWRHSPKHARDADVLVDIRPVNADSVTHYLEVLSLLRSCLEKAPGPRQRHANAPSVDEHRHDLVVSNFDSAYPRFSRCRNAHSKPPRFDPYARAPIFLSREVRPH